MAFKKQTFEEIVEAFGDEFTEEELREGLEALVAAGLVVVTTDDVTDDVSAARLIH